MITFIISCKILKKQKNHIEFSIKKQVSEVSNTLENKQVLFFKQVSVTCRKILNRKNKKQEKNSFQNLPRYLIVHIYSNRSWHQIETYLNTSQIFGYNSDLTRPVGRGGAQGARAPSVFWEKGL